MSNQGCRVISAYAGKILSIVFWCSWLTLFSFSALRHFSKVLLAVSVWLWSVPTPKLQIGYLTSFFESSPWSCITHWRGTDMWVCDMVWCHLRLLTQVLQDIRHWPKIIIENIFLVCELLKKWWISTTTTQIINNHGCYFTNGFDTLLVLWP